MNGTQLNKNLFATTGIYAIPIYTDCLINYIFTWHYRVEMYPLLLSLCCLYVSLYVLAPTYKRIESNQINRQVSSGLQQEINTIKYAHKEQIIMENISRVTTEYPQHKYTGIILHI